MTQPTAPTPRPQPGAVPPQQPQVHQPGATGAPAVPGPAAPPPSPTAWAAAAPTRRTHPAWPIAVAALTALALVLTMLLGWRTNQVTALRSELDAARAAQQTAAPRPSGQPDAPATSSAPQGRGADNRITPRPTTGPTAESLLKLARRQADDPMAKGRVDAPIVMIEWADYRCPFCSKFSLETKPALQPYVDSGSLRIEFRDLVLFGDESTLAAKGARAAGLQGKYFEFADAIWHLHTGQGHPTVTDAEITAAAKAADVADLARFQADLADPAIAEAIQADTTQATTLGINSTPFFLVNTTPVSGALPADSFTRLLEDMGATK